MDSDFAAGFVGSRALLQRLERMGSGDEQALAELIEQAQRRLRRLGRSMLKGFVGQPRLEQADDLLHAELGRLHKALAQSPPRDKQQFLRHSTTLMRGRLIDLARHAQNLVGSEADPYSRIHVGTEDSAAVSVKNPLAAPGPQSLGDWIAFHECVARLPGPEQEVFELLWYQGLTPSEAAGIMGVPERAVRRQWTSSRLRLSSLLGEKS